MSPYEKGVSDGRAWSSELLLLIAHRLANEAQIGRFNNDVRERGLSHAAVALRTIAEDIMPPRSATPPIPKQRLERLVMAIQRAEIDDDARAHRAGVIDMGCAPC